MRGRVASLLSIDAGLLGLLTGRENAQLLGVIAGLRRRAAIRALDAAKVRSDLGEAFEHPVLELASALPSPRRLIRRSFSWTRYTRRSTTS